MQLEFVPERLDQCRERASVASLGVLEIDGHRVIDTRSVGNDGRSVWRRRGVFDIDTTAKSEMS